MESADEEAVASTLFALVVGCGGEIAVAGTNGASTEDAGLATTVADEPPSGFYALTITTTADTCTPARVTGDQGPLLVSAKEDKVNIPILFVEGAEARQEMPWSGTRVNDFLDCTGWKVDVSDVHKR